jgi:dethiobiotin synthase
VTLVVVVAGTGTEVGKTWVTAAVARLLRGRGIEVRARKPVQSFDPDDLATDADRLASATGEATADVCPAHRRLPRAMAPPMAAAALGLPTFTIAELAREVTEVTEVRERDGAARLLLVESAGGVRSPLADDGDTVSLADALAPALVVLIADAGLGTLNAVRLGVAALAGHRVVVYLNRFDASDELHAANRDWLRAREGLEAVTDPEALAETLASLLDAPAATG